MRFYAKLLAVLTVAVLCFAISGHFRTMARLRTIVSRPTSDHKATEEMHAIESDLGWDLARAALPEDPPHATTAPTTIPALD